MLQRVQILPSLCLLAASAVLAGCGTSTTEAGQDPDSPSEPSGEGVLIVTPGRTAVPDTAHQGITVDVCGLGVGPLHRLLSSDETGVSNEVVPHPIDGSPTCAWTGPSGTALVTISTVSYFVPADQASVRRSPVRDVEDALGRDAVIDMTHTSISWLRDNMTVTLDVDTRPINEDELLETGRASRPSCSRMTLKWTAERRHRTGESNSAIASPRLILREDGPRFEGRDPLVRSPLCAEEVAIRRP